MVTVRKLGGGDGQCFSLFSFSQSRKESVSCVLVQYNTNGRYVIAAVYYFILLSINELL